MDVAAKDHFRKNLATAIDAKALKKIEVARDAKISRMHLDRILKDESEATLPTADRLAKACGFTLGMMLEPPEIFSEAVLTPVT